MRILVVGSGGVGSAFAPIAARRDFYEHIVFTDIDEAKGQRIVDRYGAGGRFSAARRRRDRCRAGRRGGARTRLRRDHERRRSSFRDADLPGGVRRRDHLHGHGDVALRTAPGASARAGRQEARRRPVRDGRRVGRTGAARPRRAGHRAGRVRRVRALRGRSPVQRDRRGGRARRGEPRDRGLRLRAHVLDLDHDRGVPEPAGHLGARPWLVHDGAVQRAGDLHVPRGHRPRWNA